ncbi:hypothetical protein [Lactobacillus sp. PV034]|uniref:SGNH/GDSL hydrolase family protein n=1 Tax=Lactobacillus sp. PV034 TaxID=2594495 RepID=UPI00223E99E2|nr:hypothetical protein [Lactobacillus sp. PV034]QNQ80941.1 hypothetical protein FP432_04935 [Lactobacillus sp. PV034]
MKTKKFFILLPLLLLTACQNQASHNNHISKKENSALIAKNKQKKLKEKRENFIYHGKLSPQDKKKLAKMNITAFGDSIMEGCKEDYQILFPKIQVDAGVSRQVSSVISELQNKSLPNTILIGLGTNGPFSKDQFDTIMHLIGTKREIYFINTNVDQDWQEEVNDVLATGSKQYSNVHVIDWNQYAAGHEDWFWDGIHPNIEGRQIMVDFVGRNIIADEKY